MRLGIVHGAVELHRRGVRFLRVQEAFPDVRLIAMSGGGFQPKENVLVAASMLGAITVLEKPFEMRDVLAAVHVVLQSHETD